MGHLLRLKFIRYWGLSCLFLSAGFVCAPFALIKKTLDMYSLLFLIFAANDFSHKPVGVFWLRYSFVLLLLTIIIAQYPLSDNVVLFPLTAYQVILTAALCYAAALKMTSHPFEKGGALIVFLLFGALKSLSPYNLSLFFSFEILFSLLVNFYLMFLFTSRIYTRMLTEKTSFKILGENTGDILFNYILRPAPYFSYVSPAALSMTGYRQKEFYNNANLFEELTVNSDRKSLRELFKSHEQDSLIIQWQKKNGEYIWVEFHNSPVYDGETLISVEGIIRDITEWKLAEEELLQSKKARQTLFSYISHELKTPVTSILGYAKALEFNVIDDSEKHEEALSLIVSKSLRLQRLIEDLIQLSKLEYNQFSFQFSEIPVANFFETVIKKQKAVIESAGLNFYYSISKKAADKDRSFIADLERMEQVFDNLINNAVKFTNKGGEIRLSCDLDPPRKNLVFEVRDTGIGVSPKSLPFIFDIYYKDEHAKANNLEGSGLGLSIAKEIIKGHRGDIFVESSLGKGSCFIIIVPLYTQED